MIKSMKNLITENIDTISNVLLTAIAGVSYKYSVESADKLIVHGLHILSFISVAMLLIINGDKTVKVVKSWFNKDNKDDKN